MSFIARMCERHTAKLTWVVVLGVAVSVLVGDSLWRWAAGLGPGVGFAFGAFCGSGILCCWALASAALRRRQWVRCTGAAALGCVAFLALACLVPGRNSRLLGSLGMASDRRMWVEENPAVWGAIGIGLALGALAVWCVAPRHATGRRRRPAPARE
ncbi:hypothetical protein [Streptomyces iconiensis]|uniref:Transmembrane protein n=1 Tax=Streptomyces iconiensis TaxID=1384038 RepID=A0ABT6ZUG9_9ACTN|nr:hypothetical protein [Streptomyces iconiensis]MDJ1132281.1 hypothetical protein [Streptomyces iconiensis]